MPSILFDCQEAPTVPSGDSDAELATYVIQLVLAHEDCEKQIALIKNDLELRGVTVTDVLVEEKKPRSKVLGIF